MFVPIIVVSILLACLGAFLSLESTRKKSLKNQRRHLEILSKNQTKGINLISDTSLKSISSFLDNPPPAKCITQKVGICIYSSKVKGPVGAIIYPPYMPEAKAYLESTGLTIIDGNTDDESISAIYRQLIGC